MVLHRYRIQWLHTDDSTVTIINFWWFPSSRFQHCRSDWCAKPFRNDAVHAISAVIDSQQSMHPISTFAGRPSRRSWLRSTSHADRMQKSHAARSQSQHRTFVTKVNICAQHIILTVRFASFPASAIPPTSQAALGVCVHDSTRAGVVFRFACAKS